MEGNSSSSELSMGPITAASCLLSLISSVRMCITYEFSRYVPSPDTYVQDTLSSSTVVLIAVLALGERTGYSTVTRRQSGVGAPHSGCPGCFSPSAHYYHAVSWQARISQGVMQGLNTITGIKFNILAKRPLWVWWFMSHVAR
jgi:hypothetical protein